MDNTQVGSPDARPAQRIARLVVGLVLLGLGLWTLREFLPALAWAGILAVAFWPLYESAMWRWPPGRHNILLPMGFTAGIALLFVLPIVLAGLQVGREAQTVWAWIEQVRHDGIPLPDALAHLPFGGDQVRSWWQNNLADPSGAAELLERMRNPEYLVTGRQVGIAILHRLVIFGFCLLTVFFVFQQGDTLTEQLRRASSRALGPGGERIGRQVIASIHGTVNGLVLVGLVEGILMYGVYLAAGAPRPTLLGAATAVGAIVPFGAPVVFGLAALLTFIQGLTAGAIAILAAGMVISFVADHFVRPVLIGSATKLPFIWVLFGILGGVTTWGLLGLFLGPAIMAALILLWREWTETA